MNYLDLSPTFTSLKTPFFGLMYTQPEKLFASHLTTYDP